MILYHGTISTCAENIINNGIILTKGNKYVDFGQGFYTTPDIKFAIDTAKNKCAKTNYYYNYDFCEPAVLSFKFKRNKNMKILEFQQADMNWAQFIINNRNGLDYLDKTKQVFHNLTSYYDIVIGAIADNKITSIANSLKTSGKPLICNSLSDILYNYKTTQFSFHTKQSLTCLNFISCDIIKKERRY